MHIGNVPPAGMRSQAERLARIEARKAQRTYGPRIDEPVAEQPVPVDDEAELNRWRAAQRQRLAEIDAKGGVRVVRELLRRQDSYIAALDDYAARVRALAWDGVGDPPDFGDMPRRG